MDILQHDFMIRAFIVGLLLSIIIPCIGTVVVLKRLSMIGDALAHSSLAGVTLGLVMGTNPVLTAIIICIFSALAIEVIRKRIPKYSEMAIALVMSASVGVAGILSGLVGTSQKSGNINSFLFGSIVAISDMEFAIVIIVSFCVIITFIFLYKELFFISFDERVAILAGVPVKTVNFIFTILTAVTVSIASRTVGALIVSSLMVVPIACSMQFSKSYFQTVIYSIFFAVFFTIIGLFSSYYLKLKPGASIILIGIIVFILIVSSKSIGKFVFNKKNI